MGTITRRGTAPIRAGELLRRLVVERPIGVEIGVDRGAMSVELLSRPDLYLYMVDPWGKEAAPEQYKETGDYHSWLSDAESEANYQHAIAETEFAGRRRVVLRMTSVAASNYLKGLVDFVFIDGDHSYEGVKGDIDAWRTKIIEGGILSGHDYADPNNPQFGVKKAVDEAVLIHGWKLELGENCTWFVRI